MYKVRPLAAAVIASAAISVFGLAREADATALFDASLSASLIVGVPTTATINGMPTAYVTYGPGGVNSLSSSNSGSLPTGGLPITTSVGNTPGANTGSADGAAGGSFSPGTFPTFNLYLAASADGSADGAAAPGDPLETTAIGRGVAEFALDNSTGTTDGRFGVGGNVGSWSILAEKDATDTSEFAQAVVSIGYQLLDDALEVIESDTVWIRLAEARGPLTWDEHSGGGSAERPDFPLFIVPAGETYLLRLIAQANGIATSEAAIPEPSTLVLFGLGLAGIGAVRRRKLAA